MSKFLFVFICVFGLSSVAMAQWECPSQLGGSLKPIGDSKLLWGSEITAGVGSVASNSIYNAMGLLGLDYSTNNSSFYFEGGLKYWYREDNNLNVGFHNQRFGLRELYYQYRNNSLGNITLGLQSMRTDDNYVLNERVLGVNYRKDFGKFNLNVFGGAVTKDFARNGTFCNMAYLYDILPYTNQSILGNTFGQTNMAGFTFSYKPGGETVGSEFEGNVPGNTTENKKKSLLNVSSVGLAFYSEFGSLINKSLILAGLYSNIEIGNGFWFKPEVLLQTSSGNNAIIYTPKIEKAFEWANTQRTSFMASYYGLIAIDPNAYAGNLFSNIFAGTVLRLDTPDLSFAQFGIKHSIPSIKSHIKLQYTAQTTTNGSNEFDVEIGRKFFNKLQVNGTYGYIKSPLLGSNPNLFRVELRLNF